MFCPVDEAATEPHQFYLQEKELALEQCPICRGIWVDRANLDYVTEGQAVMTDTGEPPAGRYGALRCPIDATTLVAMPELTAGQIEEIRGCPSCQGVWFSAGQLRKYVEAKRTLARNEMRLSPGISLRNFLAPNLMLFALAALLAGFGFSFGNRVTAEAGQKAARVPSELKLVLWFLVFVELLIWPIMVARDYQHLKRLGQRRAVLSFGWIIVVISTTIVTFIITQL